VKLLILSLALLSTAASGQSRMAAMLNKPVPDADHRLTYGADPLQFGELRLPKTPGLYPVVVIVHGGCWLDHLQKADPRTTTYEPLKPLAATLAAAGVATWNIEYRRAGSPNSHWPDTFLDLAAATDYLRKIAPTYNLDLKRVVIVGHSSGGQLGLWMAARPKIPASSPLYVKDPMAVKAVIDVDGPPDLAAAQPVESNFCPDPGIAPLMGGTPTEQPTRYRDGSAQFFLPLGIPQIIVTAGLLQHSAPLVNSYKAAADAKGDHLSIVNLEGSGHFDMLDPDDKSGKTLVQEILKATQ
jgi:acetyl esterase/lipase